MKAEVCGEYMGRGDESERRMDGVRSLMDIGVENE